MKKLLIAFLFGIVLISCTEHKEGQITNKSVNHIIINGKKYKFLEIVPADGERPVWLLVPEDANVEMPRVISQTYTESCGKGCSRTVFINSIWVEA